MEVRKLTITSYAKELGDHYVRLLEEKFSDKLEGEYYNLKLRTIYTEAKVTLHAIRTAANNISNHAATHLPNDFIYVLGNLSTYVNEKMYMWDLGHFLALENSLNLKYHKKSINPLQDKSRREALISAHMPFVQGRQGAITDFKLFKPVMLENSDLSIFDNWGLYRSFKDTICHSLDNLYESNPSGAIIFDFGAGWSNRMHPILTCANELTVSEYVGIDILPSCLLRSSFLNQFSLGYKISSFLCDYDYLEPRHLESFDSFTSSTGLATSLSGQFPYSDHNDVLKRFSLLTDLGIRHGVHQEADGFMFMPGDKLIENNSAAVKNLNYTYYSDYFLNGSAGSGTKDEQKNKSILLQEKSSMFQALEILSEQLEGKFEFQHFIPFQLLTGVPKSIYQWRYKADLNS